jgi:hypothetical protein
MLAAVLDPSQQALLPSRQRRQGPDGRPPQVHGPAPHLSPDPPAGIPVDLRKLLCRADARTWRHCLRNAELWEDSWR